MKNILLIAMLLTLTAQASAQSQLKPIMDYLRTAPAWIDGFVAFKGNVKLYEGSSTVLTLLKNKNIQFSLQENQIYIRPQGSFSLRYMGFKINVSEVSWDIHKGFRAKAVAAADITGLSEAYISRNVSEALGEILSERMKKANTQLYRIRRMPEFGTTVLIVKEILKIFSTTGSGGSGIALPAYAGEAGLTFNPENNKAFNLYGMRVGVKKHDSFRVGFRFNGNTSGIYPYSFNMLTTKGLDINKGTEFKQNARLILNSLEADAQGAYLDMHLGVSESIGTAIAIGEEIARATGNPVARCDQCYELAKLAPMKLMIEGWFRAATLDLVKDYTSIILALNVNPKHLNSFKRKEGCRVTASTRTRECRLKENSYEASKTCIAHAQLQLNQCLK